MRLPEFAVSLVPETTARILARKGTTLASRKASPLTSSMLLTAWKSSWYSQLTLSMTASISEESLLSMSLLPTRLQLLTSSLRQAAAVACDPLSTPDFRIAA